MSRRGGGEAGRLGGGEAIAEIQFKGTRRIGRGRSGTIERGTIERGTHPDLETVACRYWWKQKSPISAGSSSRCLVSVGWPMARESSERRRLTFSTSWERKAVLVETESWLGTCGR